MRPFTKPTYNTFIRLVLTEILSSKKFKALYKSRAIHPNTPGGFAGGPVRLIDEETEAR